MEKQESRTEGARELALRPLATEGVRETGQVTMPTGARKEG